MSKILHVDSSSRHESSVTRRLSHHLAQLLQGQKPENTVKLVDLAASHPPFLTDASVGAMFSAPDQRTPEQSQAYKVIDSYVSDVIAADVFVFGVPMYNFSVPALFKAYIDLIVIAGRTFSYGADGLKPLLHNKKAFVITSSGGDYSSEPASKMDFVEPYLRTIFGFIGITDISFVKVHGHSPDEIKAGIANAHKEIDALLGIATAQSVS